MDVVAYAVLALDVLLLALVLSLLGRAVVRAVRRYRRRGRTPELVVRRCDACRLAWKGEPGVDYGRLELLARRRERRRARAQARPAKEWAKARGWDRCPACLSTRVRTSGDGRDHGGDEEPAERRGGRLGRLRRRRRAAGAGRRGLRRQRLKRTAARQVVGQWAVLRRLVPVAVVLAVAALLGAWFGLRAQSAQSHLEAARGQLTVAKDALLDRRVDDAEQAIDRARRNTRAARSLTSDPLWRVGAAVPVLGASLADVRGLTRAVDDVAAGVLPAGLEAARMLSEGRLKTEDGRIDVDLVARAADPVGRAADRLEQTRQQVAVLPTRAVVDAVASARDELTGQLDELSSAVTKARQAVDLGPTLLGADQPRRYFVLVQQPGEARGTGGIPGGYAVVEALRGKVEVTASGSNADLQQGEVPVPEGVSEDYADEYTGNKAFELWQNVNLSPDLPTVAKVVAARWKAQGGEDVDGVITLDPVSIRDLLTGTGPLDVGDGTLVQPKDLVDYLTVGQYVGVPLGKQAERKDGLAQAASAAAKTLTAPGTDSQQLLRNLVEAVSSGHLRMAGTVPELQDRLHAAGVDGALPDGEGPVAYPVVQNATQGKLDSFLDRSISYTAGPCNQDGTRSTTVRVTLTNQAPATGLPPYLTIRNDAAGTADYQSTDSAVLLQTYVSQTADLDSATLDGRPVEVGREAGDMYEGIEGDLLFYRLFVDLPRGQPRVFELNFTEETGALVTVPEQPLVRPLVKEVTVPGC